MTGTAALPLLFFAFGIGLLWAGTNAVLRRVPVLAGWFRVSPLVVTVLLLGVMTSLAEFCVSLFASLRGQPISGRTNEELQDWIRSSNMK